MVLIQAYILIFLCERHQITKTIATMCPGFKYVFTHCAGHLRRGTTSFNLHISLELDITSTSRVREEKLKTSRVACLPVDGPTASV